MGLEWVVLEGIWDEIDCTDYLYSFEDNSMSHNTHYNGYDWEIVNDHENDEDRAWDAYRNSDQYQSPTNPMFEELRANWARTRQEALRTEAVMDVYKGLFEREESK